jgi:hypothetical protein
MSERAQPNRRRCLTTGCNPVLHGDDQAAAHTAETGHRTAAWPVRSAEGKRRARARNRTGYYDRYNVGAKSPEARGLRRGGDGFGEWDGHKTD